MLLVSMFDNCVYFRDNTALECISNSVFNISCSSETETVYKLQLLQIVFSYFVLYFYPSECSLSPSMLQRNYITYSSVKYYVFDACYRIDSVKRTTVFDVTNWNRLLDLGSVINLKIG